MADPPARGKKRVRESEEDDVGEEGSSKGHCKALQIIVNLQVRSLLGLTN